MLFWAASILCTDVGNVLGVLLIIDSFIVYSSASKRVDGVMLTLLEFVFTTIVTAIIALIVEPQFLTYPYLAIRRSGLNICVLGFIEAMGFTLSVLGDPL